MDNNPDFVYYFSYGANMNAEQMGARCRRTEIVTRARLPNYALAFFGHSPKWDSGEETVIPEQGAEVWGVIYRLRNRDLDALDAWQGIKLNGTGSYFHFPAEVVGEDGETYSVLFYKRTNQGKKTAPSAEYLSFIATGAKSRDLPAAYIQTLEAIPSVVASYLVPGRDDFIAAFLPEQGGGECAACF